MSGSKGVNEKLKVALVALVKLAYKLDGKKFPINENNQQVLLLLQWASVKRDKEVRGVLTDLVDYLSPGHKRFFESNGISFEPYIEKPDKTISVTYRGSVVDKVVEKETSAELADSSKVGKKKIIYRGQEKWV
ncbi:MAG: hypothetical protein ACRBCI_10980 [Cellvibrionaceae bacterium]